ncbi:amidohydrolase [Cryobacterium sp. Hb1]|uniref:amidohydrolase n=1 Tax=Cryobacterium sp. Hb1 TaxID=1259147 RepID=UPI00106C3B0B|nr:amidohydrolase [Cryobacterium sp. Hb1]TFD70492.1 amidohydrolase [Cryobacterium sp. Hb1]
MNTLRVTSLPEERVVNLLGLYEHLHQNPELAFQEFETAKTLSERLTGLGLTVRTGVGGTGIVALLANGGGPTVVLRADMDALPIQEDTGLAYASARTTPGGTGIMHACGHDVHMVAMLGAVEVLSTNRPDWTGNLVVVFQPAEEIGAGARAMIEDGLFDLVPTPNVILGQHVGNRPARTVSNTAGPAMAAADSLRVTINGRGAHGSRPEASIDPILIASSIVTKLQSIVAREISPADAAVVTVGSFHSGSKENIIPSTAEIKINLRSLNPAVRRRLLAAVKRIVVAECSAAGTDTAPVIESIGEFPCLVNDIVSTKRTVAALRAGLGDTSVTEMPAIMISEDFGIFGTTASVPSFSWFIGSVEPRRFAAAFADDAVDRSIPANHSAGFAPIPRRTITTGIDALLLAFSAWSGPAAKTS